MIRKLLATATWCLLLTTPTKGQNTPFSSLDVFQVEYASDVQISPDGAWVAYVRNSMSIMRDRREGRIWLVNTDGSLHRQLTSSDQTQSAPRWSPDGSRVAFVSSGNDGSEIYVYWITTGESGRLTQLDRSPRDLAWSPDGQQIAFSKLVPEAPPRLAAMPPRPDGAQWADPPLVETRVRHEADGSGYIEPGYNHIFVIPADGGTPRQVTSGNFQHRGPAWTPDGHAIVFSTNRSADWEYERVEREIYSVSTDDGAIVQLTDRSGPDANPAVSPDGSHIAYVGFDDRVQTYQTNDLYLMRADGSESRTVLNAQDR